MIQTYIKYLCVKTNGNYYSGVTYYFHEDEPVDSNFLMVVDKEDFPVTILARGE